MRDLLQAELDMDIDVGHVQSVLVLGVTEQVSPLGFEVRPHAFDGVELRGCWRQVEEVKTDACCVLLHKIRLMDRMIVENEVCVPGVRYKVLVAGIFKKVDERFCLCFVHHLVSH